MLARALFSPINSVKPTYIVDYSTIIVVEIKELLDHFAVARCFIRGNKGFGYDGVDMGYCHDRAHRTF